MALNNSGFASRRIERGLRRQSERVLVYAAVKCSCGIVGDSVQSIRSDPNCQLCGGFGLFYKDPVTILGIVTGYNVRGNAIDMAFLQPGDLMLSPLPRCPVVIGYQDKIVLPSYEDGEPFIGELLTRTRTGVERTKYPIVAIESCASVAEPGVATFYTSPADFTWSGQTLRWVTGHGPQYGTLYSLRYRARFEWLVAEPPYSRYARGTNIGQKVLLRRRDLITQVTADV